MFISSIALEDIKSHRKFEQKFGLGTTAIVGENGSGKTTIIEAVAWALFDYQPYKPIENFVRRGAKKGIVRLVFESRADSKNYEIYRDTGGGYKVYGIEEKSWITDKGDETRAFLRKHLGVESGTDLETLFLSAIGVPQGTLTADFLLTAEPRKKKFDKLLRVEDYRESEKKLGEKVGKLLREKIEAVRRRIAHAEGQLLRYDELAVEQKLLGLREAELQKMLLEVSAAIEKRRATVKVFDDTAQKLEAVKTVRVKLEFAVENAASERKRLQAEFDKAFIAKQKQTALEADYQKYVSAVGVLNRLEIRQNERNLQQNDLNKIEREFLTVEGDRKRLAENLDRAVSARREITALEPQVKIEIELDAQREILQKQAAEAKAATDSLKSTAGELDHLRIEFSKNKKSIEEAQAKKSGGDVEFLSKREVELTQQLANLSAALERDQKFQREVKNGLCPILSQKCLNLKEGETLETYFKGQFSSNTETIGVLKIEKESISRNLKTAREAEKFAVALEKLEQTGEEIKVRGLRLKTEKERLEKLAKNFESVKNEIAAAEKKIKELGKPAAKIETLKREAERETELTAKLAEIAERIVVLETKKLDSANSMKVFFDLDREFGTARRERDETKTAHDEFVRNHALAESLERRADELKVAAGEVEKLTAELAEVSRNFTEISATYDRDLHQSEKMLLNTDVLRENTVQTELRTLSIRLTRLTTEIGELEKVRESLRGERNEEDRLRKVSEATDFIRDTLKKAAAPIGAILCFEISKEANRLFREITGRTKSTLKWEDGKSDDKYDTYEITVEEDGHKRPFKNFSGGEQMAAALSVRLAMLKFLSSIRVAFFDEPTANLDPQRRELLAQQIQQIGEDEEFEQLFVISHDDTFYGYFDNYIDVKRSHEDM